jgi:ligand-binding sensor domain-containing protein/signal transduction histidine kinase
MKVVILILINIVILSDNLYPQMEDIKFKLLAEGLTKTWCILNDSKGFMWFGTRGGLNRYDGSKFVVYKNVLNDSTSLSSNWVNDILEGSDGNLWIATAYGLNMFDRDLNRFIQYVNLKNDQNSLSHNIVNDILEDSEANLWIGTDQGGLDMFNKRENNFVHYKNNPNDSMSLSNNTVDCLFEDNKGNLWVGTRDGLLNLFNKDTKSFIRFKFDNGGANPITPVWFQSMLEDKYGRIWIGTQGTGLFLIEGYNAGHIRYKQYLYEKGNINSLGHHYILSMCFDKDGKLWIGTEDKGLDIFDFDKNIFKHYRCDPNDESSISSKSIWSVYQDHIGRMWIGTFDKGINVVDKYNEKFITYRKQLNNINSLSYNNVAKFLEDKHGNFWIATDGGGLDCFDRKKNVFMHYKHNDNDVNSLSNDAVISLYMDKEENLWVGTWSGGIDVLSKDRKTYKHYNRYNGSLLSNNVHDIIDDNKGNILIATNGGGLNVYDTKKKKFSYYTHNISDSSISYDVIIQLYRDSKDQIWIGTEGSGLDLLKRDTSGHFSFVHYQYDPTDPNSISNNIVESIYEDSHQNLWIGTSNGLNLMDRESGTFTIFREEDGLPSNTINGIIEDNKGNLWLGTLNGLSKFNSSAKTFKNYNVSDGLQGNEFNGKDAAYKSRDGELFFGGTNGFNVFYPDSVKENPFIPAVYITDFTIFNKPVNIGIKDSPLKKTITETKEIMLSYEQSVFSFEFVALNYTHSEKNQYAYIMEGFEKDWNYVGTKRTATYTNLDAGKYVFKVKGSNNDGVWNEEGVSLKITITPPYWQTLWFRVMGIILVFGVLISGYKIRTARIRARNRELEQRVLDRTAQLEVANKELEAFVYSVSHDLRAPLRAIDGYTNILVEDNEQLLDEESKRVCAVICSETKRMGQLIDDLLSFSHISHAEMQVSSINMEAMVSTVFQELTTPESRERIDLQVASLPLAIGDLTLIRQVWMNLLSNAIKFSSKRERAVIEVGYQQDGQRIIYSVRDNGAGFNMQYAEKLFTVFWRLHNDREFEGTGVGLAIVQRLIHRHGGDVWAESQVDKGATFYFTVPWKGDALWTSRTS